MTGQESMQGRRWEGKVEEGLKPTWKPTIVEASKI